MYFLKCPWEITEIIDSFEKPLSGICTLSHVRSVTPVEISLTSIELSKLKGPV